MTARTTKGQVGERTSLTKYHGFQPWLHSYAATRPGSTREPLGYLTADPSRAPSFRSRATVLSWGTGSCARLALPIAISNGVCPWLVFAFRAAPCSTRNLTMVSAPLEAAPCSAVSPFVFA